MKLTYRGHAYELPTPIQLGSNSTDQPKIKLIYRGHPYYSTPRQAVVSEAVATDSSTVTLSYRGNPYERKVPFLKLYQQSRLTNWRYQKPAEG